MTDFFLARQPIYDNRANVLGYELLYRSNELNYADLQAGNRANSEVLVTALLEMGLSEVVGNRLAFINITKNYVTGELPFPLARKQIVLEIREDILPSVELINAIKQLKMRHSYTIALDDFEFDETKRALVPMADYIKINVMTLSQAEIEYQIACIGKFNGKLIAEKVVNHETYDYCRRLGFDYYQGCFFCKPQITAGEKSLGKRLGTLNLLAELQNPAITYTRLQGLFAKDISITSRVLHYINSSKFNLARPVDSMSQAISLFGIKIITTWVTILAMARIENKPDELMTIALVRARMCELLAKNTGQNPESGFLIGLFSILDALIDTSMVEIIDALPLPKEVSMTLTQQPSKLGEILAATLAYEQADWDNDILTTSFKNILTSTYIESLRWTQNVKIELLTPVR